jgi:pimeloyl-ACP methyl ester carboxylesterase
MRNLWTCLSIALSMTVRLAFAGGNPLTRPSDDPAEAFERRVLYYPRPYDGYTVDDFVSHGGVRLDYQTAQGNQTAWLVVPDHGAKTHRLWVVCGGNGTLALEMLPVCRPKVLAGDAFVMVDYPGYGACAGRPDPESIRQNVKESVLAAGKKVGIDPDKDPGMVCAFGHSMGCSAALMAVELFHLKSAVLCAPYTSTHEMAELRFGIAKDAPMWHQMDNRPGLAELSKNKGHAWIFHGSDDEIIPVQMARTLAAENKKVVRLTVVEHAHHNDLLDAAAKKIAAAMAEAGK